MPIEFLNKLPKSIQELLQSGTYTLYKSKESGSMYFVEVKPHYGYIVNERGQVLEETSLDESRFQQIIHYILPEVKKKSA